MKLKFSIDELMAFLEIQWMEGNAVRETEGFGAMWSTKGHPAAAAAAAATQVTNLARTCCSSGSPWAWGRGGQASGGTGTPINTHTWKANTIIAIHHHQLTGC